MRAASDVVVQKETATPKGLTKSYSATFSTILPTWVLPSSRACASAARSKGITCLGCGGEMRRFSAALPCCGEVRRCNAVG